MLNKYLRTVIFLLLLILINTVQASAVATITVTSPNGGETWQVGSTHNISWTVTEFADLAKVNLSYSTTGVSGPYTRFATNISNVVPYNYTWTIPNNLSSNVFVKADIINYLGTIAANDTSDNSFTISAGPLAIITVSPNPATVAPSATQQFTATGKDAYGNNVDITPTWDAGIVGSIDSSGLYTAPGADGSTTVTATDGLVSGSASVTIALVSCNDCHSSYVSAWSSTKHNIPGGPDCTGCHTGYLPVNGHLTGNKGLIVNESNTCRNSGCHETKDEKHTSSSDCTQCHFANNQKPSDLNPSYNTSDHNLTIIRNFYQYNQSGTIQMPLKSNGGLGVGTFPYYSCDAASCHHHDGSNVKVDNASETWVMSNHAQSLRYPASADNKNNCATCKSPLNYNVSNKTLNPVIAAADWQGINCRVCHNLHNRSFSGSGAGPIAFYNATQSSNVGYDVYDPVSNATVLCEKCHQPTGGSHDSNYGGTHKTTLKYTCVSCHMNTTTGAFNFQNHKFEVKNEATGVTGCENCHNPADHTFAYTANHEGKATCDACHDKTVRRNATGYASTGIYALWNDTATGEISSGKLSHGAYATWPLHNISKEVNCAKCHGTKDPSTNALLAPFPISGVACEYCHETYAKAWDSSKHNNPGAGAPNCTGCHTSYDSDTGHNGFVVNESNTCRNSGCHLTKDERHSSSSDCTQCHFANNQKPSDLNPSYNTSDHNLTIIRNFYQYNQSGTIQMPLKSNGGLGVGTFPYYSCDAASCHHHDQVNVKVDNASETWVTSNHAKSLRYPASADNKNNCATCKSPLNYNVSNKTLNPVIAAADWQGINCRVCHNLHNRSFSGSGAGPIAFYNATLSSTVGYDVYDPVSNATVLCEKCHQPTGGSHDSNYGGTHKTTLGFTCVNCHMNTTSGSFNFQNHKFEVKNEATGVTGCENCHNPADHTFQFTQTHEGKATCDACHDKTVSRNATGYASTGIYVLWNDTATGEVSSGKVSHGAVATWPLHNISKEVNCDKCHNSKDPSSNTLLAPDLTDACTSCHPNVNSADLGMHSNFNGNPAVENADCKTCHFGSFPMVKGAVNNGNTYFCADCHTTAGTGPNKSAIKFTDKNHGEAACMDCHVADGTYHQDDPRGSVANATYAGRDTTNTYTSTRTECGDCHSKANLDDAPFNAPGGGSHANGACISGGCHGPSGPVVQVVHKVNPLDAAAKKPVISTPVLDYSSVTQGTDVNITATVNLALSPAYANALVDGAQYQINNSDNTLTIRSWTPMLASDGDFNTIQEGVKGRIDTSTLSGTYNIAVRGMAGGPSQNPLERYYPMNGDVSTVKSVTLIVQPLGGYINGTINRSDNSPLVGALVSTTGASDITGPDGTYSLIVPPGTYVVTASKQPVYIDVTVTDVIVTASNTAYANMTLDEKLKGNITGSVTTE